MMCYRKWFTPISIITILTEWFSILGCAYPVLGFALRWMLVQGVYVCVLGDGQEARVSVAMGTRGACAVGGEECAHVSARMSFARTSQEFTIAQGPTRTCLRTQRASYITCAVCVSTKRAKLFPIAMKSWIIINMWIPRTLRRSLFTPHLWCSLNRVTISDKGWHVRHNTCVSSYSFSGAGMGSIFHVIGPSVRPVFVETQSFVQCKPGFPTLSVQQLKSTNW